MKSCTRYYQLLLTMFVLLLSTLAHTQSFSPCLSTLQVEATPSKHLKITWEVDNEVVSYDLERQNLSSGGWELLSDNNRDKEYIDQNTVPGETYTYRLTGNGQEREITAGIEIPSTVYRGRLLLIVESSAETALTDQLTQWMLDAEGDGWYVEKIIVTKSTGVEEVKEIIRAKYISEMGVASVMLFGDIAVPYSGTNAYDGHSNHVGAWPTDAYYADMNEYWTDEFVNIDYNSPRINNVPGDGKYDNNLINDSEVEIGRVDMSNMPVMGASEIELLAEYLEKNHRFKHKLFTPKRQGFSLNTFGGRDSGCNASRSIPPMVGHENYYSGNFRESITSDSYLFISGSGGGTYVSAQGISTSANMAQDSLQAVFATSFGSYFGDWDVSNSYLRAHLGSGTILTSVWEPKLYKTMGLGGTIGNDLRLIHRGRAFDRRVISIQGDPTLRMEMMYPVEIEDMTYTDGQVSIKWEYDRQDISDLLSFNIYRRDKSNHTYELIAKVGTDEREYIDEALAESGDTRYMIRTEYLATTPSGTYYNQSIGIPSIITIPLIDLDGDGYDSYQDCNDSDPQVYPGQIEIQNGIDDNCNGIVDEQDIDQDGYYDYEDCDDTDPAINPAAQEVASNNIDENCDGIDDHPSACYTYDGIPFDYFFNDIPCDSLSTNSSSYQVRPNDAFMLKGEDRRTYTFSFCDGYDQDLWEPLILVYAYDYENVWQSYKRVIGDLLFTSETCDATYTIDHTREHKYILIVVKDKATCGTGAVDFTPNGYINISCEYIDADGDGFYDYQECDDTNPLVNPSADEIPFNGLDDDCDPTTLDNDGDQDGFAMADDCDDTDPNINPNALEIAGNGIDDNCNGIIDELDADGDGYVSPDDCDDTNANVYPGAYDYPNNGLDEDCDGADVEVDTCFTNLIGPYDDFPIGTDFCQEEPVSSGYAVQALGSYVARDLRPDVIYEFGFCEGFENASWSALINVTLYNAETGAVGPLLNGIADCSIDFLFPGVEQYPDALFFINNAENCVSTSAPTSPSHYYLQCKQLDEDQDGYFAYEDCDDTDSTIYPNAIEVCDNIDNDCDGLVDEDLPVDTYYLDSDGDGYGDPSTGQTQCRLSDGYSDNSLDCDDTNRMINPGQSEIVYDGVDNDCDPVTLDDDLDQDGYVLADDCDDTNAAIYPGADEIPNNGIDEDCDGMDLVTTSTSELAINGAKIYPNPTSDQLFIETNTAVDYVVHLYSLEGKQIMTATNTSHLSVSQVPAGTYLLELRYVGIGHRIVKRVVIWR